MYQDSDNFNLDKNQNTTISVENDNKKQFLEKLKLKMDKLKKETKPEIKFHDTNCLFFIKFGYCKLAEKCTYIHDRSKVS